MVCSGNGKAPVLHPATQLMWSIHLAGDRYNQVLCPVCSHIPGKQPVRKHRANTFLIPKWWRCSTEEDLSWDFHHVSRCKEKPTDAHNSTSSDGCWCFSAFPCMVVSSWFSHGSNQYSKEIKFITKFWTTPVGTHHKADYCQSFFLIWNRHVKI